MANRSYINAAPAQVARSRLGGRLEDDSQLFAEFLGNDPPGEAVQCHQAVGQLYRAKRRRGILGYILINVRAAELKDERPGGVLHLETTDGFCAAPSVDGDHRIGNLIGIIGRDGYAVAKVTQNA